MKKKIGFEKIRFHFRHTSYFDTGFARFNIFEQAEVLSPRS